MKHFAHFPTVEYSDKVVLTNILVRTKIRDVVLEKTGVFYDYVIKDSDRPDILASAYYGNSDYTWAIFYANNIYDPIHDWPKTTEQFYAFIRKKYGTIEKAQSLLEPPHHYVLDDTYIIDKETFDSNTIEAERKKAVTNYDYEFELNEQKRNIKIIDVVYLRQIANEFKNIFK